MGYIVLGSEEFEAALETARRDAAPVQVESRKKAFVAAFARYGNDAVQYREEKVFFSHNEGLAYLESHPQREELVDFWGYHPEVRELPIG